MSPTRTNIKRSSRGPILVRLVCALVIVLSTIGTLYGQSNNPTGDRFRVGFSSTVFYDINVNDVNAAVKAWAHAVAVESGCPVDPDPIVLKGSAEISEALRQKSCDAFALPFPEYWELHQEAAFNPIFATVQDNKTNAEYVLLCGQERAGQGLAALRGAHLVAYHSPKTSLAPPWLDVYLHQQGAGFATNFFGRVTSVTKVSGAVLPVFFGKIDACLVDRSSFETMAELNPQISRQLKPLVTSPAYLPAVFCVRSDYDCPSKPRVLNALLNLHATPAGRQVLLVFHLERILPVTPAQFVQGNELLSLHQQLSHRAIEFANAKPLGPSEPIAAKPAAAHSTNNEVKPFLPH